MVPLQPRLQEFEVCGAEIPMATRNANQQPAGPRADGPAPRGLQETGADCRAGEPRLLAPASPEGCVAPPAAAERVCPHSGVSPCALKPCRDAPL